MNADLTKKSFYFAFTFDYPKIYYYTFLTLIYVNYSTSFLTISSFYWTYYLIYFLIILFYFLDYLTILSEIWVDFFANFYLII